MRTSVLISNYNYADFLPRALESVLMQSEKADEIIVVDDGSTDHSRQVLAPYEGRVKVIYQQNAGQAAAMNTGFAAATGDIILLLDADDAFAFNKIKILKMLYQEYEDASWIFHDLREVDGAEEEGDSETEETESAYLLISQQDMMKRGTLAYDAPATSGLSFRRSFIQKLFPLPTAGSIYISDHYIKFFCLAVANGLHVQHDLGIQYLHGDNLYTGSQTSKALATRGRIFVNTAYYLREQAPQVSVFTDNILIEGLLCAHRAGIATDVKERTRLYLETCDTKTRCRIKAKFWLKRLLGR